jgi:cytochrome c oxidase subunit 2
MQLFQQSLSTYSGDVDNLVILVTVLVGVWFLLAEAMLFWLIFRFRAREGVKAQYITGKEKHLKRWINIPHYLIIVCDIFIIIAAVKVWVKVKQTLPPADETVRIVSQQWVWTFQHPGADGKLDTPDDIRTTDELHVVADKTYHFQLQSRDVLHSFFVPVFRLKQDAVPGRVITGWFKPIHTGVHDILCAEICGIGHGVMGARIVIEDAQAHHAWVEAHTPAAATGTTEGATGAVGAAVQP